ncbi:hypothetical protein EVJ58_g1113 [Rhodofomes roseus]|uniref:Uncharacterized protein n=1 Tax=Rhodofomes roseus TaxID=34475 RepID=A0A4Y9Z2L2_9APHY|nr:hypothetical protein EVJ58_g1113 [Rhodofomes roseus]
MPVCASASPPATRSTAVQQAVSTPTHFSDSELAAPSVGKKSPGSIALADILLPVLDFSALAPANLIVAPHLPRYAL